MPDRIDSIRRQLSELGLTALLISSPASLRYLFGFTGSNGIGLITSQRCLLVTDWRYRDQANQEVQTAEIFTAYRDPYTIVRDQNILQNGDRLGFEEHHLTYRQFALIRKHFPGIKLAMTDHLIARLAISKSPQELALLRKAIAMACAVWDQVLPMIRAGITEADVAAEIVYRARKAGSQVEPFPPIVASGPRSALPHAQCSGRPLQHGDAVVIDYGCTVEGYASDVTRTICIGDPPARFREAYRAVKEAGELACAQARPNMKASDLDSIARKHIETCGFGSYFNHSLGHGIGLEVHSLPRIGPESKDVILENSVLAIEPGVYLPGAGGVRIEDNVHVTATGCEILSTAARELVCVN